MNGLRFSLKGLLVVVTLAPLGIVALVNASRVWISVVGSVTVLVLLTALLAIVCRPSPGRAFWLGFAIFGWVYLLLALFDAPLLTSLASERVYEAISREGPADGWETLPPRPYFDVICQYLWSWLLALFGGFLARYFYSAQEPAASSRDWARFEPGSEGPAERSQA